MSWAVGVQILGAEFRLIDNSHSRGATPIPCEYCGEKGTCRAQGLCSSDQLLTWRRLFLAQATGPLAEVPVPPFPHCAGIRPGPLENHDPECPVLFLSDICGSCRSLDPFDALKSEANPP